jgi:hypothetical protein
VSFIFCKIRGGTRRTPSSRTASHNELAAGARRGAACPQATLLP